MAERTTDIRSASHRRLVGRTIVRALRSAFDASYNRDRQLIDVKITQQYPLQKLDYPCIVIEYQPQRIMNAGIGHEEWFNDENNILRKWHHSRFEGTLDLNVFALSPLDRDLFADALEEVIRFGRLDAQLISFFDEIYPHEDHAPILFDSHGAVLSQLMLNVDEVDGGGNSASIAPWQPEDVLVYETNLSLEIHGGIYNVQPDETWQVVTRARAESYPQFEEDVTLPFSNDPAAVWTNPFEFEDDSVIGGEGIISGDESLV